MDVSKRIANFSKFALKLITVTVFYLTACQPGFAQMPTNCGQPDFDRFSDRGLFLWQNCGTGDWFLRATNGGLSGEFRAEGSLRLASDIEFITGFNLDAGDSGTQDLLDSSNPRNVVFRFRVFTSAQDGADFRVDPTSQTCLFVNNSAGVPIVVGQNNLELRTPLNIQTLSSVGCVSISPIISLLLEDDSTGG